MLDRHGVLAFIYHRCVARRPVRAVTMHEGVRVDCLQGF
jgi:hypothetical protein